MFPLMLSHSSMPILSVTPFNICTSLKLCMENIPLSSSYARVEFDHTCRLTIQKHGIILCILVSWSLTANPSRLYIINRFLTSCYVLICHKTLGIHLRCCITLSHRYPSLFIIW